MQTSSIIAISLGLIGLLMIWRGLRHLSRHRRIVRGSSLCVLGLLPILAGMLITVIALGLQSYRLLDGEQLAATLEFHQKGSQSYLVNYQAADGASGSFILAGDDFRIEAQFIKWQLWTRLLNLKPHYRLERLSGRYQATEQELNSDRSSIDLTRYYQRPASSLPHPELGRLARYLPAWLPLLDAEYGSATYMPMRDGERYSIMVTASGLIARKSSTL